MKTVHKSQWAGWSANGTWHRPVLVLAAVASLFVAGCYWNRFTGNYDDVFEVNNADDDSAVLEETGREEESLARIRKRLQELAADEEPVYRMSLALENICYNQPTQPGFYFGPDLFGSGAFFRGTYFPKLTPVPK